MNNSESIIVNTDDTQAIDVSKISDNIYRIRNLMFNSSSKAELSVILQAYNRLEKTKRCLNSFLENVGDIDCELFLVDNGSTDGTFEYFQSIDYPKKILIRVTKNIGGAFPYFTYTKLVNGQFILSLANDIILTKNSLQNLLQCIKSDEKIGMVNPMSTNVSNFQQPEGLTFSSYNSFKKAAANFNEKSDPSKWQERLRLITLAAIYKREVFVMSGAIDPAFLHDFGEDDLCTRIRRLGYKMYLCGDTVIHHDHDFRALEDKTEKDFMNSINSGRKLYKEKYFGLDAWDDVVAFELASSSLLTQKSIGAPSILGVDVRCGQAILDISNQLRKFGITENRRFAFTTHAKHYIDLQAVCMRLNSVYCDRVEFFTDYFSPETMDYVVLGEPVNMYHNPILLLQKLLSTLKKNGELLFKLRNTASLNTLLNSLDIETTLDPEMPAQISVEDLKSCLELMSVKKTQTVAILTKYDKESLASIRNLIKSMGLNENVDACVNNFTTRDYLFHVVK